MIKQQLLFNGDLNLQDDIKSIKVGDYIHALNFRNVFTENGIDQSGENISSNIQVNFGLPAGTNRCVGFLEDAVNNTAFYWIWNSNLNHRILRYYADITGNGHIEVILSGTVLGLTQYNFVTHANLIGDLLYWVEGENPQRKINVRKANNTDKIITFKLCISDDHSGTFKLDATDGFNVVSITTGATGTRAEQCAQLTNNLNADISFSPFFIATNKIDYIEISALTPGIWTITVTKISGNGSAWYKALNWYPTITLKTLDPVAWPMWGEPDTSFGLDTSLDINLLNGNSYQFRTKILYEDGEVSSLSKASRMMYNNVTDVSYQIQNYLDYDQGTSQIHSNFIKVQYTDGGRVLGQRELVKGVEIYMRNTNTDKYRRVAYIYDYDLDGIYNFLNNVTGEPIITTPAQDEYNAIPLNSKAQEVVNNKLFYMHNLVGYDTFNVTGRVFVDYTAGPGPVTPLVPYNKMNPKSLGKYRFGIVFYDRLGRNNFVNTAINFEVVIPAPIFYAGGGNGFQPIVRFSIDKFLVPPDWATHYGWVRTRELIRAAYYKVRVPTPASIIYKDASGVTQAWPNATIKTAILPTVTSIFDNNTYSESTQGDIMQINRYSAGVLQETLNQPIVGYDPSNNNTIIEYDLSANSALPDLKDVNAATLKDYMYEIYTPRHEQINEPFYEFYQTFPILDAETPSRRFGAGYNGVNQVVGTIAATGEFYFGWDTVRMTRPYGSGSWVLTEQPYFDHVTPVITQDTGRATNVIPENKQVLLQDNIVFSDVYNIGTAYNGFGTWEPLNNRNVPTGYGGIYLARNMDNVLVIITKNKAFSVYVDKGVLQGQDGSTVVSLSDLVIGAIRDLNGLYGTVNPESAAVNDGLLFWWDVYRGVVCQYSANGIDEMSKYKATRFFANKGSIGVRADRTTYKVLGAIHKPFKEYIMAFCETTVDSVVQPAETIAFNYAVNGWKTRYSYLPEMMGGLGNNLITFNTGNFWLHNNRASKNSFYGVEYPCEVSVVVNDNPSMNKSMLSLSVEASGKPNFPAITTPISEWNVAGQLSELLETDFEFMNGSYFSNFLMSAITPNAISPAEGLINGEALQGQTMILKLSKISTTLFWIKSAECYYIPDMLTND